jgi:hypothetical protein
MKRYKIIDETFIVSKIELSKENEKALELEAEKFRIYEKFMGERPILNR